MMSGVQQVLGVVGPEKTLQACEVTVTLVFNVDCSPGILSASHFSTISISGHSVGGDNSKWNQVFFLLKIFMITWNIWIEEVVDLDVVLINLVSNLNKTSVIVVKMQINTFCLNFLSSSDVNESDLAMTGTMLTMS